MAMRLVKGRRVNRTGQRVREQVLDMRLIGELDGSYYLQIGERRVFLGQEPDTRWVFVGEDLLKLLLDWSEEDYERLQAFVEEIAGSECSSSFDNRWCDTPMLWAVMRQAPF